MFGRRRSLATPQSKGPTKKQRRSSFDSQTELLKCLMRAGIRFSGDSETFILSKEHTLIYQSLSSYFSECSSANLEGILKEISAAVESEDLLLKFIAPIESPNDVATFGLQNSVFRTLLEVDQLHAFLLELMMKVIFKISNGERKITGDTDVPRLLLNQVRWLTSTEQSSLTVDKLFSLLDVCNEQIQKDIILTLPDIVSEDSQVAKISDHLKDLLLTNSGLSSAILDTLSNLNMDDDTIGEVQEITLNLLESAPLSTVPIIVKFLLQTIPKDQNEWILTQIREKLEFTSDNSEDEIVCSTPFDDPPAISLKAGEESLDLILVETIQINFQFKKSLGDNWLKLIDGLTKPDAYNTCDFIILLILHDTITKKRPIETVFRNKIRQQCLTREIIENFLFRLKPIAKRFFKSLLAIAESLMVMKDPKLYTFGSLIYQAAFQNLDTFYQQEVIGALVTHVGTRSSVEVDAAMVTLLEIANSDPDKLAAFEIFITSLLDHVEQLSTKQVRYLYGILSSMAFKSSKKLRVQQDLFILIRKQLAHHQALYKAIGVIGAVTMIEYLVGTSWLDVSSVNLPSQLQRSSLGSVSSNSPVAGTSTGGGGGTTSEGCRTVVSLLQMVRDSYSRSPEVGSLFMDELGRVLVRGGLDEKIEQWISDNVLKDFQADFVVSNEPSSDFSRLLSLEDSVICEVAINLGPLWHQYHTERDEIKEKREKVAGGSKKRRLVSPVCLAPHFRLLALCEHRQQDGNLEGIDALLGCPLLLAARSTDPVPTLLAINWLIEVVNAFSRQPSPEMQAKVLARLTDIVRLRGQLKGELSQAPDTLLPVAVFEASQSTVRIPRAVKRSTNKKQAVTKKKKPTVKKKTKTCEDNGVDSEGEDRENNENEDPDHESQSSSLPSVQIIKPKEPEVDLCNIQACFRELDLDVHQMLGASEVVDIAVDSEDQQIERRCVKLGRPAILLLVEDLANKARFSLNTVSISGIGVVGKPVSAVASLQFRNLEVLSQESVAGKFVDFLPGLCEQLEKAAAYFQCVKPNNSPAGSQADLSSSMLVVDLKSNEGATVAAILSHTLDVLLYLFRWLLQHPAAPFDLLKTAVTHIAARLNEDPTDKDFSPSFTAAVQSTIYYLSRFAPDSMPHVHSAVLVCRSIFLLDERLANDSPSSSPPRTKQRGKKSTAGAEENSRKVDLHDFTRSLVDRDWDSSVVWQGMLPTLNALLFHTSKSSRKFRDALHYLVGFHVSSSQSKFSFVEEFIRERLVGFSSQDERKDGYLTLTKLYFSVYYREMLDALLSEAKTLHLPTERGALVSDRQRSALLARWTRVIVALSQLADVAKENPTSSLLVAFIRSGRLMMQTLLKEAMPLLDVMFRQHREAVTAFLKSVQQVTRFMQHLCGHVKCKRDAGLAAQVPLTKRCLETFVYRVKVMLSHNHCVEAFWLGNLKNRTLQGEEIHSEEEEDEERDGSGPESEAESVSSRQSDASEEVEVRTSESF